MCKPCLLYTSPLQQQRSSCGYSHHATHPLFFLSKVLPCCYYTHLTAAGESYRQRKAATLTILLISSIWLLVIVLCFDGFSRCFYFAAVNPHRTVHGGGREEQPLCFSGSSQEFFAVNNRQMPSKTYCTLSHPFLLLYCCCSLCR